MPGAESGSVVGVDMQPSLQSVLTVYSSSSLGHTRAVPLLDDVLGASDPEDAVIDDMTIFEGQLSAADEVGESARLRAAELHHARAAWVRSELLAWKVEGPVPIHIDILIGDKHDAME